MDGVAAPDGKGLDGQMSGTPKGAGAEAPRDGELPKREAAHTGHNHHHHHTQTKAVLNRIARVTGHLQSVGRMVEDGRDCSEVLIQLAAVRSAVTEISRIVLTDHMEHCIAEAVHHNDEETLQELNKAIAMLLK